MLLGLVFVFELEKEYTFGCRNKWCCVPFFVQIIGDLVASPALPPGAVALYTSCIRAGKAVLSMQAGSAGCVECVLQPKGTLVVFMSAMGQPGNLSHHTGHQIRRVQPA